MYKIYSLFFIYFFILFQSHSYSTEQKIVYLNLDLIFQNSTPGSLILNELKDQNKANIKKFKSREDDLRKEEQDIIKKKNILSKEEFDSKVLSLREKMNIFNKEKEQTFLNYEKEKKKK